MLLVDYPAATLHETHKGICVIDLDKVWCDMELFDIYAKGFIEGCGGRLTVKEIEMLPMGAMVMTYGCGMRFLTDHLQGDTYFKIHRENHNLDILRELLKRH